MSSIPSWKNRSTERVPSFFYCKMIDLFLPQIVKLMESHMGHTKDLGHFPHQSAYRKIMSQLLVTSLYSITKSVPDPFIPFFLVEIEIFLENGAILGEIYKNGGHF